MLYRRSSVLSAVCVTLGVVFPVFAQPSAYDLLEASRAALGGKKLADLHSLAIWGPARRGAQSSESALSMELSGRLLEEHLTMASGGEIQRTQLTDDGTFGPATGGMPGDSGGPALQPFTTECLSGDQYWAKLRASAVEGLPETADSARRRAFTARFAQYALAFTLSPPTNYPVTFTYGGRVDSPGGPADGIEAKGPAGFSARLFIDVKTHMPVMIDYAETGRDVQLWLRDYRPEGGILFPHDLAWISGGAVIEEFQVKRIAINPKFADKKFVK